MLVMNLGNDELISTSNGWLVVACMGSMAETVHSVCCSPLGAARGWGASVGTLSWTGWSASLTLLTNTVSPIVSVSRAGSWAWRGQPNIGRRGLAGLCGDEQCNSYYCCPRWQLGGCPGGGKTISKEGDECGEDEEEEKDVPTCELITIRVWKAL